MTSLTSVVKVQLLGARRPQWSSPLLSYHHDLISFVPEADTAGPGHECLQVPEVPGGLNNLRGIAGLLAPRLLSLLVVNACYWCVLYGIFTPPSILLGA